MNRLSRRLLGIRPNLYEVNDKTWVVTTQAGFKKIVKSVLKYNDDFTGYPKSYPSVITYTVEYRGYFNAHFTCTPLSNYKKSLRDTLLKLEEIDSQISC